MRTRTLRLLLLLALLGSTLSVFAEMNYRLGLELGFDRIKPSSVPQGAIIESQNPSIVNPYTGHHFDVSDIGRYDPKHFSSGLNMQNQWSANLVGQVFPNKGTIVPYAAGRLWLTGGFNSIRGSYGSGYGYEKVLGGGADYVRYIYGVKTRIDPSLELGVRFVPDDYYLKNGKTGVFSIGLERRHQMAKFYKGIEAYGSPEHLTFLGEVEDNVTALYLRYENGDNSGTLVFPLSGQKGFALMFKADLLKKH